MSRPTYHDPESPSETERVAKVSASKRPSKIAAPHDAEAEAAFIAQLRANLEAAGVDKATQDLVAAELYDGIPPAPAQASPGCEPEVVPPAPPDLDRLLLPVPGKGTRPTPLPRPGLAGGGAE